MDAVAPCAIIPVCGDVPVKGQRRKRQKRLLVQLFLDFAKNTTLHGLRYLADAGLHIIEKLFWLVTFLGSVAICFFFIYNVWYKWKTSPVIVSFSSKHVSTDEVPLPSITICPDVKFLQETFNYSEVWRMHKYNDLSSPYSNNTAVLKGFDLATLLCDEVNVFIDKEKKYLDVSEVLQLIDLSMNFSTYGWYCVKEGIGCDESANELFERVLTKSGICYNFNGLSAKSMLTNKVRTDYKYTFKTGNAENWNMDDGYLIDTIENVYPFRGRNSFGKPYFEWYLKNYEEKKDALCNGFYSGYKIYLHHPADYPQSLLYHFSVVPRMQTSLAITFTMETANPDLKDYPVEIRQCYFPDDKLASLTYFKQYTYNNCMLECLTKYVDKECGCVGFYMPFHNKSRICSSVKQICVLTAEATFIHFKKIKECRCLPACNFIHYDAEVHKTSISMGTYFNAHFGDDYKQRYNKTYDPESFTDSYLEIFFKQPMFRTVHRSVLFSLSDFLGNCGGLLGLFLGFSWLSLVEIFYFLTFRVFKTIRNDLKSEKSTKNNINK